MTYVISDLHGRFDLFEQLLEHVAFGATDTLYILGDVVDRNRGGIRILKAIMDRPNIRMLLGNHEHMLLHAIPEPEGLSLNGRETNRELWYRNGGQITQEEFEEEPEEERERILRYLRRLPLNLEVSVGQTRFLLCHAAPVCMFRTYGIFYANETEFARDKPFGYTAATMPEYVEEKTGGEFKAADVTGISLEDIHNMDYDKIQAQLMAVKDFKKIIVKEFAYLEADLCVFI